MLQGPELLNLTVKDVKRSDGTVRQVIEVARLRAKPLVRCALSKASVDALGKWITVSGKKRADYIFPGRRGRSSHPMTVRQMGRLLKLWVAAAGLDPNKYGTESLPDEGSSHLEWHRRFGDSPGAFGPHEDRVNSEVSTHRKKVRPDRN